MKQLTEVVKEIGRSRLKPKKIKSSLDDIKTDTDVVEVNPVISTGL